MLTLCTLSFSHAIGHVYPAFRSYRALAGRGGRDALKPWLVYWSVLGLFRVGEYFADMALFWYAGPRPMRNTRLYECV